MILVSLPLLKVFLECLFEHQLTCFGVDFVVLLFELLVFTIVIWIMDIANFLEVSFLSFDLHLRS
jgi:hypothetical protein